MAIAAPGRRIADCIRCAARFTQPFLEYLALQGNDLITPRPEYDFAGLTPGDCWCVCVRSWAQAFEAGCASPVALEACHISVLEFVDLESLKAHALKA